MADGNIAFNASINTGGFKSGAAELQSIASKMSSAVGSQFTALAGKVVAIGAAFVGVHQAANAFRDALNMGGRLSDLSKTTGETAGNLAVLERAFANAGVGAERLGPALSSMANFVTDFRNGSETAAKAASALGITLGDLEGKTPTEQMQMFMSAIAGIKDPTTRAALAMDVFKKAGKEIVPLATEFAGEVSNARSELGSLPEILTKNADAMDNLGDKLENSIGNKLTEFAAGMAAGVQGANDLATALSRIDAAGMGQNLGEQLRNAFAAPLETAKAIGYTLLTGAKEAGNALINVAVFAGQTWVKTVSAADYLQGLSMRLQAGMMEAVNAFNKLLAYGVDYIFLRPLSNLPGILGAPFKSAFAVLQDITASLTKTSQDNYALWEKGGELIKGSFDSAVSSTEILSKDWLGVEQSANDAARHIMAAQEKGSAVIAQDMAKARVDSERIAEAMQRAKQNPFSPMFDKFGKDTPQEPFKFEPRYPGSENFPTSGGPGAPVIEPAGGGGGGGGGGFGGGGGTRPPKTATEYETEMRAAAEAARHSDRARSLQDSGHYTSAGRAMERADKAAEAVRERARVRDYIEKEYGATNVGQAYQEYRRRTNMDRMTQQEFERDLRNKARTDQERKDREEKTRGTDEPSAPDRSGTGASDTGLATEGTLKQILKKIQERPILVA